LSAEAEVSYSLHYAMMGAPTQILDFWQAVGYNERGGLR